MPELPEVETIRRQLVRTIKGQKIVDVEVRWGKRLIPGKSKFIAELKGRTIKDIKRRGKLMQIELSGGKSMFVHLKMTGQLLLKDKDAVAEKHAHVIFKLSGLKDLHWVDMRKFGFIKLMDADEAEAYLASWKFGPEPLARGFTYVVFRDCLMHYPNAKIKPKLMEQTCVAGIGNIYAVEALWAAKIHPLTKIKDIPEVKFKKLHRDIVRILKDAVKTGGTSAANYFDAFGKAGGYEKKIKAYQQEGKPCQHCGTKLIKLKVGGRGTVICPKCQKF
ncbi:MAG: bifunctional DNA-formamidopyrimidine glycosylase/DNA-(apurinic or apyrimidinic site) lyase [Candidatus Uhrbacteria bacterium]|nr:bifunctional DNA-formamidopyrimidine glycosylase/DNA-(apurinic or apyrimidinic site) lyase [Patescibacteria group bacterium]MBU1906683.1 bifunctional DNA-formamidopyrimidine glycosylase/DNA-(apurinic or apyrimidinic site) lyase [Patescibacteria group bacterium]